jgi:hypothetical protein
LICFLFSFLVSSFLLAAPAIAQSDPTVSVPSASSPAPPRPQRVVVEETLHGHKIADPFRWLEDRESAATQQFDRDELNYTRTVLDPLPGRDAMHVRLSELFSVGMLGTPVVGGDYYFTAAARAIRISRCSTCARD